MLAQTVWQSAALGVISLIADRDEDFSQEIFVSPISRYSIVVGKIIGESLVALPQAIAILAVGVLLGVPLSLAMIVALVPVVCVIAVFGGAFGILVLSNLGSQRTANQIFPFIMLPQFFLAGVINPLQNLPWFLDVLSRLAPMRYAVDLLRNVYYGFQPVGRARRGVERAGEPRGHRRDVRRLHRGGDGAVRPGGAQSLGRRLRGRLLGGSVGWRSPRPFGRPAAVASRSDSMSESTLPAGAGAPAPSLPRLGQPAPDFEAVTTHGTIRLGDYRDRWLILFSHPADFTPVCTTEFIAFARIYPDLQARGVDLLGLSIDSVYSHIAWARNIEEKMGVEVPFPIIADLDRKVAETYGMIMPGESKTEAPGASSSSTPRARSGR